MANLRSPAPAGVAIGALANNCEITVRVTRTVQQLEHPATARAFPLVVDHGGKMAFR